MEHAHGKGSGTEEKEWMAGAINLTPNSCKSNAWELGFLFDSAFRTSHTATFPFGVTPNVRMDAWAGRNGFVCHLSVYHHGLRFVGLFPNQAIIAQARIRIGR
jgi:hypothetical protein